VDTTADGSDGECANDCTLREAIALADFNNGQFVRVPPGVYRINAPLVLQDDYVFGVGLTGTFSAGARTTIIDARGSGRVFEVPASSSAFVAGLTLTGGSAATGAAAQVQSGGQLTLYDTILKDNTASQRGGAVASDGDLVIWTSTITRNRVTGGSGGGLAGNPGSDTFIYKSTLSGNTASGPGGAIAMAGNLIMQNATIARNSASVGGGLFRETASGGDGVWNTILSGNAGGDCGGAIAGSRSITAGNLAGDASCLFATASEGMNSTDPRLGPLRNNGGPTDTHALAAASPAINAGDQDICGAGSPDQRHAPAPDACDIGAFEHGAKPPELELPPPVSGETVNVSESRGRVRIKLPGSDEFFELEDGQQVPVGSTFDTSKGRVNLQAAGSQRAWFYQGVFKLGQKKGRKPLSTLTLTGKLNCGAGNQANAAARRKKKRRLWGDGRGRFRTKGRHSAATVVGTKWLVEDRCNGTLTKVVKGRVTVRAGKRTIRLRAGRQFFARAK